MQQVKVQLTVKFKIKRFEDDETTVEDILKGMEGLLAHRSQPLPEIPCIFENITTTEQQ